MRWLHRRKLLVLTVFTFLLFHIVSSVKASPYYLTHPSYFPSKQGSYITFDTSLLPLTFTTLYRNTLTRWFFNSTWVTSTVDTTITIFHLGGWFNYTVASAGTQRINNGSQPDTVFINGVLKTVGDGWTYSGGTVTVTGSSSNASLGWTGAGSPDSTSPSWTIIRVTTTDAGANAEFNCTWTDNIMLSGFIFGTDNLGSWVNDTWSSLSGTEDVASVVKALTSEVDKTVYYRFWCNDTSDNWGSTGTLPLTTSGTGITYAGGLYLLTVKTTRNGFPCSANVTVQNHISKRSDIINGIASFQLSMGTYDVEVSFGGETLEETVDLSSHTVIPFDFSSGEKADPRTTITFFVGLPLLAIIIIFGLWWMKKA